MTDTPAGVFWVFARRAHTDPFEQVGAVKAASEAIAYVYARMNYRERTWRDMCVVPRDAFYQPAPEVQAPPDAQAAQEPH